MPAANKLATILDNIVRRNDDASWDRLFRFCYRCLRVPKRGRHRRSLAGEVNLLLRDEADPPPSTQSGNQHPRPAQDPLKPLASRVSFKLLEGGYRAAVRLICSEDSTVELDKTTLVALRSKHPPPHPDLRTPPPPRGHAPTTPVSEVEVVQVIRSFPNGSAGVPDGLRPQHLKNLLSASAERGGKEVLWALTAFINLVLEGKTPPSVRPFFFGASLIPLEKKGGGIRSNSPLFGYQMCYLQSVACHRNPLGTTTAGVRNAFRM